MKETRRTNTKRSGVASWRHQALRVWLMVVVSSTCHAVFMLTLD